MTVDSAWAKKHKRTLVTTELLGLAMIPDAPFEQADGTAYQLDIDYVGRKRNTENPSPGPFEWSNETVIRIKVWPKR